MLTPTEKRRVIDIATGKLCPENGIEKHFLQVVNGHGLPCTPKEKAWCSYYKEHSDLHAKADQVKPSQRTSNYPRRSETQRKSVKIKVEQITELIEGYRGESRIRDVIIQEYEELEALRNENNALFSAPRASEPTSARAGYGGLCSFPNSA